LDEIGRISIRPDPPVHCWSIRLERITLCLMSTITFRTDDEVDRALAELSSSERDRSQVIRDAIIAAWHRQRAAQLRAEAEAVAADADVLADMESLRAW
jgi:predicted transcriptional regulator